jgi:hypothetical protein
MSTGSEEDEFGGVLSVADEGAVEDDEGGSAGEGFAGGVD